MDKNVMHWKEGVGLVAQMRHGSISSICGICGSHRLYRQALLALPCGVVHSRASTTAPD
jgi:hypothetical protein